MPHITLLGRNLKCLCQTFSNYLWGTFGAGIPRLSLQNLPYRNLPLPLPQMGLTDGVDGLLCQDKVGGGHGAGCPAPAPLKPAGYHWKFTSIRLANGVLGSRVQPSC